MDFKEQALEYHRRSPKGKIEVVPTKETATADDLSLAYSPGVAFPCLEIEKDAETVYEYTNKGNLVGIISNGTAVLGLGDLGASASKPVMEGKAVLFKNFAGIDVFDIELKTKDSGEFINAVKLMEPTFGGINLEDIKAPECFYIEEKLIELMDIPVFHDDQHGTAIITTSAVYNYFHLTEKDPSKAKVVISGAGAAAISIGRLLQEIGIKSENILMADSKGILNNKRNDIIGMKSEFIRDTNDVTIGDSLKGADIFVGVSVKDLVSPDMVKSMADKPCVLALANPDPEIPYPLAKQARNDVIMGTGRSDYPNQVNNVLGFPFIFRGALDMRARKINMEMKKAAIYAIAELARKEVPDSVSQAYKGEKFSFGPEYIIPKPFDSRVYYEVSTAVAKAAHTSGVARVNYPGDEAYKESLRRRKQI
ncbi:MAG: malate dehydrogenase [Leptospiraceae bacterium]|nr:malate dehydrogenase [Leptospiraceae bacterium]MCP5513591.1 malate dehydrogenase [Leptospiraceae bacterium]